MTKDDINYPEVNECNGSAVGIRQWFPKAEKKNTHTSQNFRNSAVYMCSYIIFLKDLETNFSYLISYFHFCGTMLSFVI